MESVFHIHIIISTYSRAFFLYKMSIYSCEIRVCIKITIIIVISAVVVVFVIIIRRPSRTLILIPIPILLQITQQQQQYYHDGNDQLNQMLVNKSNQQQKNTFVYKRMGSRARVYFFAFRLSIFPVSGVLFISPINKFCCMTRTSEKRKVFYVCQNRKSLNSDALARILMAFIFHKKFKSEKQHLALATKWIRVTSNAKILFWLQITLKSI